MFNNERDQINTHFVDPDDFDMLNFPFVVSEMETVVPDENPFNVIPQFRSIRQRRYSLRYFPFPDEGNKPFHRYCLPYRPIYLPANNIRNVDNIYGIISEDKENMITMKLVDNGDLEELELSEEEKMLICKDKLKKHSSLFIDDMHSSINSALLPDILSIILEYSQTNIFNDTNWGKLLEVEYPIDQEATINEVCPFHNLDFEEQYRGYRYPKCNGCVFGRNFFRFMMTHFEWSRNMWNEFLPLEERIEQFINEIAVYINIMKLPSEFIEECYQVLRHKYLILYKLPLTTPLRLLPF